MRYALASVTVLAALMLAGNSTAAHRHRHPCRTSTPYVCTWRLARRWYGWTGAEWRALDSLVSRESGWDPCAVYPSQHDCGYRGSNACGIPQAYPCTKTWWGRQGDLYGTRYAQARWTLRYIRVRWGDPINAAWHEANGGY